MQSVAGDGTAAPPPPPLRRTSATHLNHLASSASSLSRMDTPLAAPDGAAAPPTGALPPHGPASSAATGSGALHGEGSTRGPSISIHADGSAHGGRHFFDGPGAAGGSTHGGVPAPRPDSRHSDHTAVWLVEDGSTRGGTPRPQLDKQPSEGGKGASASTVPPGPGGASGRRKGDFGQAAVVVEDGGQRPVLDLRTYFSSLPKKLKGGLDTRLPIPPARDIFWAWLGAFLGILAVCAMNQWASPEIDIGFLVGSFGASAVLVFALLESKMSQPRNFLGGQVLSAVVGITVRVIIHQTWIAGPVGMSLALVVMQLTATTHPPGGATALIACTLPELPKWHGYSFVITVLVGSLAMQLIALLVNNIDPRRRYPTYWY